MSLAITNIVLGVLVVAGLIGVIYVESMDAELEPEQLEPYVAEARERLDQHSEVIEAELSEVVSRITPPIQEAIARQAKEDSAAYLNALEAEGEQYLSNLEDIFLARVRANHKEVLQAHVNVLREEFPEHVNDENVERVLTEFEKAFDRVAERYYVEEFRRATQRTVALWERVETLEPRQPDQPPLEDRLADAVVDWMALTAANEAEEAINQAVEAPREPRR